MVKRVYSLMIYKYINILIFRAFCANASILWKRIAVACWTRMASCLG
ncbi:hypothetical protein LOKO_02638 [Halomonas chromatireducens]|uniref:Uncharacterized protein n=1 Tax=Halomonas chromatireducens TaxID=507626 RepID=A0A109UME9_9GAMM|nr:hypothetical protein LOKO_02638 [Halomonas chromatireducens]